MFELTANDKASLFDCLLQRRVHEYFDVDGRPIGEGRAHAFAEVETQFKTCPYAGSRFHHEYPMNMSALQSILPEWQNSLTLLAWLSRRYQAYYQTDVSSYYDLALISGSGVFLTDYMLLRRFNPLLNRQIPVWMSGLYKVCLGFQQATFLAMMNDQFENKAVVGCLPDAKGFYAYLENQLLLIGEAEVCGGSEEMISRAYEIMKTKDSTLELSLQLPQLAEMAIDWDAYDVFTFHTSNLFRKAILFAIQMPSYCVELHDAYLPASLADAINTYLKSSFSSLLNAQTGLAVEIARFTLAESGRSEEEWFSLRAKFLEETSCQQTFHSTYDLSEAIVLQLAKVFELSIYQPVIECAVREQLAKYEAFEAAALAAFNEHLEYILAALGYSNAGAALGPDVLSALYGKTLRNWPEMMWASRLTALTNPSTAGENKEVSPLAC